MKPDVKLNFNQGMLRPLTTDDIHDGYLDGLNDPEVNRYLDRKSEVVHTFQSLGEFVEKECASYDSILWGVWILGVEKHIGTARIHSIDLNHKIGCIGICLFNKKYWGTGVGSQVIHEITEWAHNNLLLHWVEAGIYEKNLASQKAFLSAGYKWIYEIKNKFLLDGQPTNVKYYAKIKLDAET